MSPRGPLPAAVYWRRRAVVLSVVAVLALLVANLVRGGDDAEPAAGSTGEQASVVSGEPTEGPTVDPEADGTTPDDTDGATDDTGNGRGKKRGNGNGGTEAPSDEPSETAPPEPVLPEPSGACDEADVTMSPFVQGAVAGQPVTITLQLRTVESEACTWRLSSEHLALRITQDTESVWASWECPRQLPDEEVTVYRDSTTAVDVVWNSRYSEAGCPAQPDWAAAGDYVVRTSTFGGEPSDEVAFTLRDPNTPNAGSTDGSGDDA